MAEYGLIGKNIEHSFSKSFFTAKFDKEKRKDTYQNFDIQDINQLHDILLKHKDLKGLNVTIPFKENVIPLLDKIDKEAKKIGAVNTIKINRKRKLIGYNTDHYGFARVVGDFLPLKKKTALVLGTGGVSKAIIYVLKFMDFDYKIVSRTKIENNLTYNELDKDIIDKHFLIINCTPLGTYPNIKNYPNIPYKYLTKEHFLFDLTYNPQVTEFMKIGLLQGTRVSNGLKMLEYQANKAWTIWKL